MLYEDFVGGAATQKFGAVPNLAIEIDSLNYYIFIVSAHGRGCSARQDDAEICVRGICQRILKICVSE